VAVDYPKGFARRFLEEAASYGHAWANLDLDSGEIDYIEDPSDSADDEVSTATARVAIADKDLEPVWGDLVSEARSFYPSLPIEESVGALLSVIIEEFVLTNYTPAPRFFSLAQILR
jgi:hypothetical protein